MTRKSGEQREAPSLPSFIPSQSSGLHCAPHSGGPKGTLPPKSTSPSRLRRTRGGLRGGEWRRGPGRGERVYLSHVPPIMSPPVVRTDGQARRLTVLIYFDFTSRASTLQAGLSAISPNYLSYLVFSPSGYLRGEINTMPLTFPNRQSSVLICSALARNIHAYMR